MRLWRGFGHAMRSRQARICDAHHAAVGKGEEMAAVGKRDLCQLRRVGKQIGAHVTGQNGVLCAVQGQ